jgi:hypothetical protein
MVTWKILLTMGQEFSGPTKQRQSKTSASFRISSTKQKILQPNDTVEG